MTKKLDVHYQGLTDDGNRLRVTVFDVDAPLKTDPLNLGTDEKPMWVEFVCGHTARHNVNNDDEDTDACYPPDPEFDDDGD